MHDVFEGICHYNMCHIIKYLIEDAKLITLDILNDNKRLFDYGPTEIDNLSGDIKTEHLKNRHLKMSAREMMSFVHHFPLLVGDYVPEGNEVWNFFLLFLDMIDTLMSSQFSEETLLTLQNQIKDHNYLFVKLFKDTLKFKYHILTHYPNVIRKSGPPKYSWCMRFEAKHREVKM